MVEALSFGSASFFVVMRIEQLPENSNSPFYPTFGKNVNNCANLLNIWRFVHV